MNAIEFVKKFGWKEAQVCLLNCAMPQDKWFMHSGSLIEGQDFDDLKQIVEAFELVESYGGLKACHEKLYMLHELTEDPAPIREAIELVEKCNASD